MATETKIPSVSPETRKGYWQRILRPLFWWLLLVLVLLVIHQHQVWIERTRIYCTVTMYETNVLYDAVGTLDGHPIRSGENIPLGSHQFTITEPKAESFTTNFFAWYGRHDFGKINLKRAMGTLTLMAEPAAKVITITGPEFSLTLHDFTGTNLLVPTDRYHVSAQYARWSDAQNYQVTPGNSTFGSFTPQLGAVSVTCNETPSIFELQDANGNVIEKGDLPAVVTELPTGNYFVLVTYHNHALKQGIIVSAKETNDVPFHFSLGAVRFESVPPGVAVSTANGVYLGTTPLVVTELPPSKAEYRLQLNGYDDATVSVTVVEGQTNATTATLVSLSYLGAMRTARQEIAAGNYRYALNSLEQALLAKPGDTEALNLQTKAKGRELVQEAKALADQSDYSGAGEKLQAALKILPDDTEATNLQTTYTSREAEQQRLIAERQKEDLERQRAQAVANAEKQRQERLNRPHDYFLRLMSQTPNSAGSVEQRLTANGDVRDLRRRIADALSKSLLLTFTIEQNNEAFPDGFLIRAKLSSLDGFRRCYIVGGQTANGEVTILFKVLEYTWPPDLSLSAVLSKPNEDSAIPIDQSNLYDSSKESHRALGIKIVTQRIQEAIKQSAAN